MRAVVSCAKSSLTATGVLVPIDYVRLKNWYIRRLDTDTLILCGDRLVEEKVYRYQQFGLLRLTKVVSSGFQASCVGTDGVTVVWNCRWDMSDTYFAYKPQGLIPILERYQPNGAKLRDYLGAVGIVSIFENKDNPRPYQEAIE